MSTIVTDTLQGKTSATSITLPTTTNIGSTPLVSASANSMTIRGEGSAVTNIQQGLCKMWLNVADNSTNNDSLNVASHTDAGEGRQKVGITNPFGATTTMSGAGTGAETSGNNGSTNNNRSSFFIRGDSASEAFLNTLTCSSGNLEDCNISSGVMMGDLA